MKINFWIFKIHLSHSEPTNNDIQFLFHRKYKYVCSRNLFDNFDKLKTSLIYIYIYIFYLDTTPLQRGRPLSG